MGRRRRKPTGFYPVIMEHTSCEKLENNYLLQTVDHKKNAINYIVSFDLFPYYVLKILEYVAITGEITHEEARETLYDDVFSVYKTKVSTVRISLLILNFLVKEGILYSDDNEEYRLVKNQDDVRRWYLEYFAENNNT